MSDKAPERLWYGRTMPCMYNAEKDVPEWENDVVELVNADLYEQLQAERDELEEALKWAYYDWDKDPERVVPLPQDLSNKERKKKIAPAY